ncbi:zinc finger protein 493-like [Biomphalaria glabrata]|uniref:Zinc finger protein 493-like n=1 Tax=Biomphalaria glabrata TaxID=6526 RepID=A0A9W2Z5N3_BIOGL|nr:zinc finger protein 493-like [Biomphalaria glabrata]
MDLQSRQQFQCVHCNRRFRRRHSLTVHLKKYLLVYTCTLCNKSMSVLESLRVHLWCHFQKGNLCTLCNKSFIKISLLKVHLLRHVLAESCPYTCRVCNRIFLLERTFRCHQLAHLHKKFYYCDSYGNKFYSKFAYQRHKLAYCHKAQYMCLDCNKNFKTLKYTKQHMKVHIKPSEKQVLSLRCELCFKILRSRSGLHKHLVCHIKSKQHHICTGCQRSFALYKRLQLHRLHCHQLAHLQKKFYQCESCGKNFYSKFRFQRHKLTYCHKAQYTCLDCNKNFKTLKYMKQHMNVHIKPSEKQVLSLRCELCYKIFRSRSGLHKHLVCHIKSKDHHICTGCQRSFAHNKRLQLHQRLHCHVYKCLDCNKNLNSPYYMKQHMNSHINPSVPLLKCEFCFDTFRSHAHLHVHKVFFCKYKGTQGPTNQSSQSIGPFKIQNRLNSNNYQSYRSQPKKNNNYGTSSQPKDNTDIPIESHNLTGSRKFLSDVVFQCQQRFSGACPQFCNKKLERHSDMTKHLHSQMKSSEMMSKYNTLRAARESNQSMTSFNIHKGVHLNEYPPKQIQIHQQAFRSHRGRQTMNMSAMRVTSKNHKAQFYYCQICLQSFLAESDLKRHLLLHGANEWHNHGQNYYIFRLGNENFATSSSLNNCIDRRSDLTRLNQKLIEETTFPPLHWDAKAHVMPDCSSYGPDRVHNLQGLLHGPDRAHNMQGPQHGPDRVHYLQGLQHGPERVHNLHGLQHGPERVHTMQAPCFTEKITAHVFEHCLYNGMEKRILPMIPMMYDHAMPYNYHNGLKCNRESFSNQFTLPQF